MIPSDLGRAWPILAGLSHVSAVNGWFLWDWLVSLASSGAPGTIEPLSLHGVSASSRLAWAVHKVVKGLQGQQESKSQGASTAQVSADTLASVLLTPKQVTCPSPEPGWEGTFQGSA